MPAGLLENCHNLYTTFIQKEMVHMLGSCTKLLEPLKEELLSLLQDMQWHKYVAAYWDNLKDIVDLVLHPDKWDMSDEGQVLSKLPRISDKWMEKVCDTH